MKIGLQIADIYPLGSVADVGATLGKIAKMADDVGFYSLWVSDHLLNASSVFGEPIDSPVLEGYSTVSYFVGLTKRIKVGLLVSCNVFRHPALLVKTVSTIDVLSGGRAYLGVGAGWFEREAIGLGFAFPSRRERFRRLEETLQIAKLMWGNSRTPFNGEYYQLAEPFNSPQPLTKPHPPILIGGGGEKKTLRLVARYGNACNFFIGSSLREVPASWRRMYENRSEFLRHKLAVLKQHCSDVGTSYEGIEKTAQTYVRLGVNSQSVEEVVALCRELAELGITHLIIDIPNLNGTVPIEDIGRDVIPKVSVF